MYILCLHLTYLAGIYFTDIRKPQISGRTTADKEEALNPTCTVDSFSSSVINLTIFEKSNLQIKISMILQNSSENLKQEQSGMNTLFINSVKAKDAGLYICTAKVPNITLTEEINVTVTCKYCIFYIFFFFYLSAKCWRQKRADNVQNLFCFLFICLATKRRTKGELVGCVRIRRKCFEFPSFPVIQDLKSSFTIK